MCNRVKAFIPGHQNRCRCMYSFIIRLHVIIFSESDIEWKDVTEIYWRKKTSTNSCPVYFTFVVIKTIK